MSMAAGTATSHPLTVQYRRKKKYISLLSLIQIGRRKRGLFLAVLLLIGFVTLHLSIRALQDVVATRTLIQDFEASIERWRTRKPFRAKEISLRYGIPQTPRIHNCTAMQTVGFVPASVDCSIKECSPQLIPRLIFQTWKTTSLEMEICEMTKSWFGLNEDYDYLLFDDNAVDRMIALEFGDRIHTAYSCINAGAAKSDVWRLLVIYLYGGIYFDLDTMSKSSFAEWNFGNDTVITGNGNGEPHQWGLIYTRFDPILRETIHRTLRELATRRADGVQHISYNHYVQSFRDGGSPFREGWGDYFDDRVIFHSTAGKEVMKKKSPYWITMKGGRRVWKPGCYRPYFFYK